jgi:RNA polymerase sigma-70 factor (ECF subfamily)
LTAAPLAENFFRHEYSRLVAALCAQVGAQNLEVVEDAVQSALLKALSTWTLGGQPENPSGWLFVVARNEMLGELRKRSGRHRIHERLRLSEAPTKEAEAPDSTLHAEVSDELLRMLFVCCDETIPLESQLALALKVLCGFSVSEIALRLFTSEANIYKRVARARERLRQLPATREGPDPAQYDQRLPFVRQVLYLLFTEGHLSSHATETIRRELCEEALRLASLLAEHPRGAAPESSALVALMYLHLARFPGRHDAGGGLLLLEQQDRSRWDRKAIGLGLRWLERSAQGDEFSRYHAEAAIAAEHCLAPSFEETRWAQVAENYALLERATPSPMHRLNRALAVAQFRGPEAGLAILEDLEAPSWLAGSYMWMATLADLHARCGHAKEAKRHRDAAIESAPSDALKAALTRRLVDTGTT